ncbi:DUF1330 domain-containing protein [Kribbella sp. NBC_00889]|uniref:DUF1330 domain-containing protein n=1 Tax=Kribbella sp. NBC_00889 TaxID=2975974 RepID=UPI00386879A7|nr:DUF1330 domain-containing protein [Kribbella sp. NBC_00889]
MTAYAIAYLRNIKFGADIIEYLHRVDATLAPYDGHFIVHGDDAEPIEGEWGGAPIVIEFPDYDQLRGWYDSAAYREILHLRTDNSDSTVIFVKGCGRDHKATDVLV